MTDENKDVQFVETVAKMLVEQPDMVEVNRTVDDLGVLITLKVAAGDMATIIGREGRAAKAVRTLLRIIGAKKNERVNLKIVEPEGSEHNNEMAAPAASSDDMSQEPVQEVPAEEAPAEEYSAPEAATTQSEDDFLGDIPAPLA